MPSDAAPEIASFYTRADEHPRLRSGWGRLELERTQELLLRRLPPPPATILDVGGATGVYSEWLGERGYQVHLVDLTPSHIERARRECRHLASASVADARRLPQPDAFANAVLLMGPLYHLPEREDRLRALAEARRVLAPGGILFAAAISRFASLLDSLVSGWMTRPELWGMVDATLGDGRHRNPTADVEFFTSAYFHVPSELAAEIEQAGFESLDLTAIEGPGWLAQSFEEHWPEEAWRNRLLELVRRVEREPSLMGLSSHLLASARRG